ncbi:putative beta-1,3-glucanase, partial [Mycobacterium montefiorense]
MDRRRMMLTTGLGMLAAAASMPLPEALASPSAPQAPPSAGG